MRPPQLPGWASFPDGFAPTGQGSQSFAEDLLKAIPSHTLRVAIDGITAAGKSTLAHELGEGMRVSVFSTTAIGVRARFGA